MIQISFLINEFHFVVFNVVPADEKIEALKGMITKKDNINPF
jgi:hypothetical protein